MFINIYSCIVSEKKDKKSSRLEYNVFERKRGVALYMYSVRKVTSRETQFKCPALLKLVHYDL